MTTIGYQNIEDVLLSLQDPNTWWAVSNVPWVSSPKINAGVSVYNVEADWTWIAWWSTNVSWSSSDYNIVAWSSWYIYMPDWTNLTVSSGNTGNMSSMTYIYYDMETSSVATTTSASASVWENKILLCVAKPTSSGKDAEFQAFGTWYQSTFITADNIAANTITGNEIAANTITANEMDVNRLSAISADLWTVTAWDISWTTITAWSTSSWAVKLYPYSSTRWKIDFYYSWSVVATMRWNSAPSLWGVLYIQWDYVYTSGRMFCGGKLRIPVWSNLYG